MAVHLWRTEELVKELAARAVSEKDCLGYVVVGALGYHFGAYYSAWSWGCFRDGLGGTLVAEVVLVSMIALWGLWASYQANGAEEGKDFALRYFLISIPVGLKILGATVLLGEGLGRIGYEVLGRVPFFHPSDLQSAIAFSIGLALVVAYYWRIATYMRLLRILEAQTVAPKLESAPAQTGK